jgi:hypothetical protein
MTRQGTSLSQTRNACRFFPEIRKATMSRTIEAIMAHMVPPEKREALPVKNSKLVAQWQDGPETISHDRRTGGRHPSSRSQ